MAQSSNTEEVALKWLIRIDGGPLNAAEEAAFDQWLNESIRHQATYLRLRHAWTKGNRLSQLRPLDGSIDEDLLAPEPFWRAHFSRGALFSMRVALASTACIAVIAWIVLLSPNWDDFTTGVGDSQNITLADGSRLVLNTNTHVRVSLRKGQRLLLVEQGEAFFEVAHDERRPFNVRAGATTLRAVGTAFSVRREPGGDVDVIVVEGSVAIDPDAAGGIGGKAASLLVLGDIASIRGEGMAITKASESQLQHRLAWTKGILWFDDIPLLEVAAEFNRYNRRLLVVSDPAIASLKIGGSFQATDLASFISALESLRVTAVTEQRSDGEVVIRLFGAAGSQSL